MGVSEFYLVNLIDRLGRQPIHEIMREDERERGNRVVVPGKVPWLSADDWDPTIVVSLDHKDVRLIAILANSPGNGSFRRLVAGIQAEGLTPVVLAPSIELRATLRRWGWRCRYVGRGVTREEQWRPRKRRAA